MNKSKITENQRDINYTVVFSKRRTIGISVSPEKGVVIRAPFRTPTARIEDVIRSKANWIIKYQEKFLGLENKQVPVSYTEGSEHLYLGNNNILNIVKSQKTYLRLQDGIFEMGMIRPEDESFAKKILFKWYKDEAARFFSLKLNAVLLQHASYNFRPTSLVIRTMKRRWGSCSIKGKITLNTELIKMSEPCIEYVIIHELCHLRHHNHGKEFYYLLSELFPAWKQYRLKLKEHYLL